MMSAKWAAIKDSLKMDKDVQHAVRAAQTAPVCLHAINVLINARNADPQTHVKYALKATD